LLKIANENGGLLFFSILFAILNSLLGTVTAVCMISRLLKGIVTILSMDQMK
jgi:hypothetical protein